MMRDMTTEKTFDCIEFKRRSQARLMEEYETQKDKYPSFRDFINAMTEQDSLAKAFWNDRNR